MKVKKFLLILALLITTQVFASKGVVQYVHDGDTVRINVHGTKVKVRLAGIDAPELKQNYGYESKAALKSLIDNQTVYFHSNKKDRYGRIIARLYSDPNMTNSINARMVEVGGAWWYKKYAPKDKELQLLQQNARTHQLGLWKDTNPIPPWLYRKRNRN